MRKRVALLIVTACSLYSSCQLSGQEKSEPPIVFRIELDTRANVNFDATYSPDKSVVLRRVKNSISNERVQLFDTARDMPLGPEIELKGRITALAVSPDNTTVATAIGDQDRGEIHFWNGNTGNEIKYSAPADCLPPNLRVVNKLSFSDDGKRVKAQAILLCYIQIDTSAKAKHEATYSPDKSVFLRRFIDSGRVQLFDAARETSLGPEIDLKARVSALAVSPDNRTIATAIGNRSGYWGEVRVWDGTSGKEIAKYVGPGVKKSFELGEVTKLSFSDDGKTVTVLSGEDSGK